ncbi:MAG: N-acetylmuramoyl-L-alanine amidase [Coriobacteriales bacterium]|jgi:surface antigen|nr:N-acetylmuramoyl-L-alanine amidase [Coriobacteriales bacterium]
MSRSGKEKRTRQTFKLACCACLVPVLLAFTACGQAADAGSAATGGAQFDNAATIQDTPAAGNTQNGAGATDSKAKSAQSSDAQALWQSLGVSVDTHAKLEHGPKPASDQLYVVLHDTETSGSAASVVSAWAASGGNRTGIAAHFVIGRDGKIVQAVPLDQIAHHVGAGNKGMDAKFGVKYDATRDDGMSPEEKNQVKMGYTSTGMNDFSIGIELVHNGQSDYLVAQLKALDALIKYLDAYYRGAPKGNAGTIIQHKSWRTSNPDCSAAFQKYFKNYQKYRSYKVG